MKKSLSIIIGTLIAFAFISCSTPTTSTPAADDGSGTTTDGTTTDTTGTDTAGGTTDTPVTTPDTVTYLYTATAGATTDISYVRDLWGSGTTSTDVKTDATYANAVSATYAGTGWGACIAFTKLPAGTLSLYKNIVFKIKTTDYTSILVKVSPTEKTYALSTGTALAGGWVQMTVPMSDFGNDPASSTEFAILNNITPKAAGSFLITDVGLSGTSTAVNLTGLTSALTAANTLLAAHIVGTDDGNVPQAAHDAYSAAITSAQAVKDSASATQAQVVAAVSALDSATTTFKAAFIVAVPSVLADTSAWAWTDAKTTAVYSSSVVYTDNISVNAWDQYWWGTVTVSDYSVGSTGKNVKKYAGLKGDGCSRGIEFSSAFDAATAGKTNFHCDIYTASGTSVTLRFVCTDGGSGDKLVTLTPNAWTSVDIDLTSLTGLTATNKMVQIGIVGGTTATQSDTIYIDNLLFHQ